MEMLEIFTNVLKISYLIFYMIGMITIQCFMAFFLLRPRVVMTDIKIFYALITSLFLLIMKFIQTFLILFKHAICQDEELFDKSYKQYSYYFSTLHEITLLKVNEIYTFSKMINYIYNH